MKWIKDASPQNQNILKKDIECTWVEKYITFRQDHSETLHLTDAHFLAEILIEGEHDFDSVSASLFVNDSSIPMVNYSGSDKVAFSQAPFFYNRKSKSFDDLDALEKKHPPSDKYVWEISGPNGFFRLEPIRIGGPEAITQIPKVSKIRLNQNKIAVSDYMNIDPNTDLMIEWDPFNTGSDFDGNGWDDIMFVLVSNCYGEIILTGGAADTNDPFISCHDVSAILPKERMNPGEEYTVFISQVKIVDQNHSSGIHQVANNSFATELLIRTSGNSTHQKKSPLVKPAQHLWSRKTIGNDMESWPTLVDFY